MRGSGNIMNVLFSSDDEYARHLGAAMHSLLRHNADADGINIYVIDNGISDDSKQRLDRIAVEFANTALHFIDFSGWKSKLKLNLPWQIALSSYARIFLGSMLPQDVHRVIYMDCDMIVCDSLVALWAEDLGDMVAAAVQDTVSPATKTAVGLDPDDRYFNAGMLLVDLDKWRALDLEKACMQFIDDHAGNVMHHDQGILNGVLRNRWKRLGVRYNLMTINYIFSLPEISRYYGDPAEYYSAAEVDEARQTPAILHFTPSFTTRPWVSNCKHPLRGRYWDELALTPWLGEKPEADRSKIAVKLINWWYRTFGA